MQRWQPNIFHQPQNSQKLKKKTIWQDKSANASRKDCVESLFDF